MNHGEKPLKLVKLSATRWLAFSSAVTTVTHQYEALKKMFNAEKFKTGQEKCAMSRLLADMFNDNMNWVFLVFLEPILKDISVLNLSFQCTDADHTKLYADLRRFLLATCKRFIKPAFFDDKGSNTTVLSRSDIDMVEIALKNVDVTFGNSCLPLESIDYGGKDFKNAVSQAKPNDDQRDVVYEKCRKFLIRLCRELNERLPANLNLVEKIQFLSPSKCLGQSNLDVLEKWPWELGIITNIVKFSFEI